MVSYTWSARQDQLDRVANIRRRRFVPEPRVAAKRLPWVSECWFSSSTPSGSRPADAEIQWQVCSLLALVPFEPLIKLNVVFVQQLPQFILGGEGQMDRDCGQRLRHRMSLPCRNPVGVVLSLVNHYPRVAAPRQPRAGGRNAFGVFPRGTESHTVIWSAMHEHLILCLTLSVPTRMCYGGFMPVRPRTVWYIGNPFGP